MGFVFIFVGRVDRRKYVLAQFIVAWWIFIFYAQGQSVIVIFFRG
jgi:hypothetical protein